MCQLDKGCKKGKWSLSYTKWRYCIYWTRGKNSATDIHHCVANAWMNHNIRQNQQKIREALQPVRRQRQKLLVHHNLFFEKTEGVLYVWLEGKTQKMVALCVSITWRMPRGSHRQCLPARCSNIISRITAKRWPDKSTSICTGINLLEPEFYI